MNLTLEFRRSVWLNQRWNRTENDVLADRKGDYVVMRDGAAKRDIKVYLPSNIQSRQPVEK